jgi:hypothetical protein
MREGGKLGREDLARVWGRGRVGGRLSLRLRARAGARARARVRVRVGARARG